MTKKSSKFKDLLKDAIRLCLIKRGWHPFLALKERKLLAQGIALCKTNSTKLPHAMPLKRGMKLSGAKVRGV